MHACLLLPVCCFICVCKKGFLRFSPCWWWLLLVVSVVVVALCLCAWAWPSHPVCVAAGFFFPSLSSHKQKASSCDKKTKNSMDLFSKRFYSIFTLSPSHVSINPPLFLFWFPNTAFYLNVYVCSFFPQLSDAQPTLPILAHDILPAPRPSISHAD